MSAVVDGCLGRQIGRCGVGSSHAALLLCLLVAVGCTPEAVAPTPAAPTRAAPTASPSTMPAPRADDREARWAAVDSWVYQLTGYRDGKLDEIAASAYDLAVIDLARDGSEDVFTREEIRSLQVSGKIVLAYFEVGAIEDFRPEWSEVPEELKLGEIAGWPGERYVAYWDARWWPVIQGRIDRALASGFDGAYLDIVNAYEEIPDDAAGTDREDLARCMVALLGRISAYAKAHDAAFRIVPQNAPELYLYAGYLEAIDGLGMEELTVLATDRLCDADWCEENRAAAAAVGEAGKLVLAVDYADEPANIDLAYRAARAIGFVPYVTVVELDRVRVNTGWEP
jgi:cysteinyl-tRNA synthetase, unknown class